MTEDIQQLALRSFTTLFALRPVWGGSIVLVLGLDGQGAALSIAANIAGAVSLAIEDDPVRLREAMRHGAVDFVVNTLDEAIRAMKNEVRRQTPLSVALVADPMAMLAEILDRGLTAQVFTSFAAISKDDEIVQRASSHFAAMGADLIDFSARNHDGIYKDSQSLIDLEISKFGWALENFEFGSTAELRAFDARALSIFADQDHLRRRWLQAAPKILQRQRPHQRSIWLSHEEKVFLDKALDG